MAQGNVIPWKFCYPGTRQDAHTEHQHPIGYGTSCRLCEHGVECEPKGAHGSPFSDSASSLALKEMAWLIIKTGTLFSIVMFTPPGINIMWDDKQEGARILI